MLRLNALVNAYKKTKEMNYYSLNDFNKETIEKGLSQKESVLARIFVWNSAISIIKQHVLFGVGPGDVSDALISYDKSNGLDTLQKYDTHNNPELQHLFLYGVYHYQEYNMHNQFLETIVGLGLPGLSILLLLTFGILIFCFIKKDLLLGVFSFLIIINFSVESMLQMDYFSLFFSLFLYMFIKVNTIAKYKVPSHLHVVG